MLHTPACSFLSMAIETISRATGRAGDTVAHVAAVGVAACALLTGITTAAAAGQATPAVTITSIAPASASYGESVTISGTGFGGQNVDIRVGGVPAMVVSATGARATFRVPVGVPIGSTTVTVTNPGGRRGAVAFDLNGRITLTLDEAHRAEQVLGAAGGTLTTTSNGISYSLTIPPGAMIDDETIGLTPVTGLAGLPINTLLGAAHFSPEGLQFAKPATLTIVLPPAANTHNLVGFSAVGNGQDLHLVPVETSTGAITVPVLHFSITGAGTASLVAAGAMNCGSTPTLECTYEQALAIAQLQAEQTICATDCATPADMSEHALAIQTEWATAEIPLIREWFNKTLDLLNGAGLTDDDGLRQASREYEAWRAWINGSPCGTADCDLLSEFQNDVNIGDDALAEDLGAAFARAHAACNDQRVADLIRQVDLLSLQGLGHLPPDDQGLKDAYACQLVIVASLPASVHQGDTVPMTVNVGVRTGGAGGPVSPQSGADVLIQISDGCGALGSGLARDVTGQTDASGNVATAVHITSTCVGSTTSTQLTMSVPDLIDAASATLIALGHSVSYTMQIEMPVITILPGDAIVGPGGTVDFSASASGLGPLYNWSATGGTIPPGPSATATFTAGSTAGTFAVKAVSVTDPNDSATATVTVVNSNPIALVSRTCSAQAVGQSFFGAQTVLQKKSCTPFPPYVSPDLTINDSVDLYNYATKYTEDLSPTGGTLDILAEVDAPLVDPSVTTNPNGVVASAFADLSFKIPDGETYLLTVNATVSTNNIFLFSGPRLDIRGSTLPDKLIIVDPSTCTPGGDGIPPSCVQTVQFSTLVTGTVEFTPIVTSGFTTVGIVDQQKRMGEVKVTFTFQKQ